MLREIALRQIRQILLLIGNYPLSVSFVIMVGAIAALELIQRYGLAMLGLDQWRDQVFRIADISFAPEVWLSVIGLTLGTLVIAISIAAQTIPKVAQLYMQDWISLLYMWFVILGGAHAVAVKFYQDNQDVLLASAGLNVLILLPFSIILALPYIFYVLRNIQPDRVIRLIVSRHLAQIRRLGRPALQPLLQKDLYRDTYQRDLLESFNQLESIFGYVSFKEPKAQILQRVSQLLQEYIWIKPSIHVAFFQVGPMVRQDITFQTMVDQFEAVERSHTFYEQKCVRVLGNTYLSLLDDREFDLAALCGYELSQIGATAIKANDDLVLHILMIRFNTLMRFAFKHGVTHNEARHLYNLVFHYRRFIEFLIQFDKRDQAKQAVYYLRRYGNEAHDYGQTSPVLYFIVDVIAAEIKKLLILANECYWPLSLQGNLLNELLQVDAPLEVDPTNPEEPRHRNQGVRTLQIGLALYYLEVEKLEFVDRIIEDILDDMVVLGRLPFQRVMQITCDRIRTTQPTFWEDTDRGNVNLYHTPHAHQIPRFIECLNLHIKAAETSGKSP
jgi:hypothetical protein